MILSILAAALLAAEPASIVYDVTLLPGSRGAFVEAEVSGARRADVKGWIAAREGLGTVTTIEDTDAGFRFAYTVPLPAAETADATQPSLTDERFRGVLSQLLLAPDLPPLAARVCVRGPAGWSMAGLDGTSACTSAANLDNIFFAPIAAGDYRLVEDQVGDSRLTLAVRPDHPLGAEAVAAASKRLLTGLSDYADHPLPPSVFLIADVREGRPAAHPAQNISNARFSATTLLDADTADAADPRVWGTYAHELAHSFTPAAFGDRGVTRSELGSVFAEGFTDYLAYRVALASGVHDQGTFLRAVAGFWAEYVNVRETAANDVDREFLNYRQGMIAALMIDLELLRLTDGRAGFREFVRALFDQGGSNGLTRVDVAAALGSVGGQRAAALYETLSTSRTLDPVPALRAVGFDLRGTGATWTLEAISGVSGQVQRRRTRFLAG